MNKWNSKYLQALKKQGTIAGYKVPERKKAYSEGKEVKIPGPRPKALLWLDLNLQLWSNEHQLTLEMEYRFTKDRRFRFDYCWPSIRLALEFEGGIFMAKSGHNTARHYTKDADKYNLAAVLGWRIVRCTALNYTTVLKTLNEMVK